MTTTVLLVEAKDCDLEATMLSGLPEKNLTYLAAVVLRTCMEQGASLADILDLTNCVAVRSAGSVPPPFIVQGNAG